MADVTAANITLLDASPQVDVPNHKLQQGVVYSIVDTVETSTIMSINDKIGQNVIGVSEVKPIERVTVENTDQIINDFVHKTAFLDLSDNRVTIYTLGQFPNKIKYENHFKRSSLESS